MTESVIVTFKPYIGAALLSAREGDLKSVKYFTSLPFDPEMVDDDDRNNLARLSGFIQRAEEIENDFGRGAILDLNVERIAELVTQGWISDEEVNNARAFRATDKAIAPALMLEIGGAITGNAPLDRLIS
jgi:hypothetical protein